MKTIRKTIAFPAKILAIINRRAEKFGLSTIDFIRFLVLKEAEEEKKPKLSQQSEKKLTETIQAYEAGELKTFDNAEELINSFNLK